MFLSDESTISTLPWSAHDKILVVLNLHIHMVIYFGMMGDFCPCVFCLLSISVGKITDPTMWKSGLRESHWVLSLWVLSFLLSYLYNTILVNILTMKDNNRAIVPFTKFTENSTTQFNSSINSKLNELTQNSMTQFYSSTLDICQYSLHSMIKTSLAGGMRKSSQRSNH